MRLAAALALALVLVPACGKDRLVAPAGASASTPAPPTSGDAPPNRGPGNRPGAAASSSVRVEVTAPGSVVIRNDGDTAVGIAWELPIEHQHDGAWSSVHTMAMKTDCATAPPADECVRVPPHGSFAPLPWTGWFGCTQCDTCRANVPAPAGRYRIVAVECGSGLRHESAPLSLVSPGRFAHTPRVFAPADQPNAVPIDNETD